MHARKALQWHAFLNQRVVDLFDLGLAADQPQVTQVARGKRAQRIEVVAVSAGDDDDIRRLWNVRLVQPVGNRIDGDLVGLGKSLGVGELLAVIENVDAKAGGTRDLRELMADVAGANDIELRGRFNGLDVDGHLSPANET